jgi:hypothetical protein
MSYEHSGNLGDMSDYLPSAVKVAARSAGVEPISSADNLVTEATDAQELQGMLEAEMTRTMSDRLERDEDYNAERYVIIIIIVQSTSDKCNKMGVGNLLHLSENFTYPKLPIFTPL